MGKIIAVVSGKGGTGKTTFTSCIGFALASMGKKVLCLDCDISLRNLDLALGLSDSALMDFSDVLSGRCTLEQAVVSHPKYPSLFLLAAPLNDGGQWDMFANIVEKYGVVPKTAYPESKASSGSREMDMTLTEKLREDACILRKLHKEGKGLDELRARGEIPTEFGETLSWKYLTYVRAHPIAWHVPTRILYGAHDDLTSPETISAFARRVGAELTVMPDGEHWFHTEEQLRFLDAWITEDAGR